MKKIFTILLSAVLALCLFTVAGCDKRPVLTMATNAAFAPFEYKEGNKFKGIDVELAQAIADELGYRLVIDDMEFPSVITSVSNGQADIALAALTVSEDRRQHVNFSDSYFNASQYIIVAADDDRFSSVENDEEAEASDVEDIINGLGANAKIGFQNGTTGSYYAKGDEDWGFPGFEDAVKQGYANGTQALADLRLGRINIIVIDEMPARTIVEKNDDVKLIEVPLTDEEYAIAVKKGDAELLSKINEALNKFMEDGTFQSILEKYYLGD
jgi:ABC-type amino acid transport substrate-binding protein